MRKSYHLKSDTKSVSHVVGIIKGNGKPLRAKSIGRNAPCKCGSGKKSKSCCGSETKYFKQ